MAARRGASDCREKEEEEEGLAAADDVVAGAAAAIAAGGVGWCRGGDGPGSRGEDLAALIGCGADDVAAFPFPRARVCR